MEADGKNKDAKADAETKDAEGDAETKDAEADAENNAEVYSKNDEEVDEMQSFEVIGLLKHWWDMQVFDTGQRKIICSLLQLVFNFFGRSIANICI